MRDVIYSPTAARRSRSAARPSPTASSIVENGNALTFIGVDAQYFSAVLMPQGDAADNMDQSLPIRVGDVELGREKLTNTSFRITSIARELKPGAVADGPLRALRRPEAAGRCWPNTSWATSSTTAGSAGSPKPMLWTLHLFYAVIRNYGLAIILLDGAGAAVHVPLEPQAGPGRPEDAGAAAGDQEDPGEVQEGHGGADQGPAGAVPQAQLQSAERLPGAVHPVADLRRPVPLADGRRRAARRPAALRGGPLVLEPGGPRHALRLELAACRSSSTAASAWFGLGPYFNILPILTIALFILQQKMFMPPPTDEQSAMQQKMMKYMMIFMGFMFYKVASGLCIYFIASSLWGLAERKFLPKTAAAAAGREASPGPRNPGIGSAAFGRATTRIATEEKETAAGNRRLGKGEGGRRKAEAQRAGGEAARAVSTHSPRPDARLRFRKRR